jgi:hypothetical protein
VAAGTDTEDPRRPSRAPNPRPAVLQIPIPVLSLFHRRPLGELLLNPNPSPSPSHRGGIGGEEEGEALEMGEKATRTAIAPHRRVDLKPRSTVRAPARGPRSRSCGARTPPRSHGPRRPGVGAAQAGNRTSLSARSASGFTATAPRTVSSPTPISSTCGHPG